MLAEVEAAIKDDPRWHVFYRSGSDVDFVPKDWMEWLPPIGIDRKEHPESWIVFRFSLYERSIDYYVEIRKLEDAAQRKAIVDALIDKGATFGFVRKQAREATGFYTRVSSRERVLLFNQDETPTADAIRAAVKKRLDQIHPKMGELAKALQELLKSTASK